MTVGENREAERLALLAIGARSKERSAQEAARERTIEYFDAAVVAGWPWYRIGHVLGISGNGAKNYYQRNRRKVRGGNLV